MGSADPVEPGGAGRGRLSPAVWWFVGGYGVSAVGTGATYPFLTIYLRDALHLSAPTSALALLLLAGIAVPFSLLAGRWCDNKRARHVALVGLLTQAVGWSVLASASSGAIVLAALALVGAGTGAFMPAVVPLLHGLTTSEQQRARAQSLRYLLLNAGLGAGAALAAVALRHPVASTYRALFLVDAVSCVLYAAVLLLRVAASAPAPVRAAGAGAAGRVWRNGNMALLLVAQLLLVTFGLSQIELGIPLLLRTRLGISPTTIGVLFTVGTLVIVAGQLPVGRLVERVHKTRALSCLAACWLLAWALGATATATAGTSRVILLGAMLVAFTLGECAYSPAFYSLVGQLAPDGALGRSSGATFAVFNLGSMLGPPGAVLVTSTGPAGLLWLVLGAAAALTAAVMLLLDHRLHHPHESARGQLRSQLA